MAPSSRGSVVREGRARRVALAAALVLAACHASKGGAPAPTLVSLTLSRTSAVMATGDLLEIAATGQRSDGSTVQVSGLAWSSSNPAVARIEVEGGRLLVRAVASGTAVISAVHDRSGLCAALDVTARDVQVLAFGAGDLPRADKVDVTQRYYRVRNLTPGAFYRIGLDDLDDDVDLQVGQDVALAAERLSCLSEEVGLVPETCLAPANGLGELWIAADGQWSEQGSELTLDVQPATPRPVRATVAFPGGFPVTGTVDAVDAFFRVTGLTPGARYLVALSQLSDDVDLEVYADAYAWAEACAAFTSGTAPEACTVVAPAGGELLVELDGDSVVGSSTFRLDVTAAP